MPIYEYNCNKCGHSFDILARSHDEPKPDCPKCGCNETKKIISPLGYLKHPDHGGSGQLTSGNSSDGASK